MFDTRPSNDEAKARWWRRLAVGGLLVMLGACGDDKKTIIQGGQGELGNNDSFPASSIASTDVEHSSEFTVSYPSGTGTAGMDGRSAGEMQATATNCPGFSVPPFGAQVRISGTGARSPLPNGGSVTAQTTTDVPGGGRANAVLTINVVGTDRISVRESFTFTDRGNCTLELSGTLAKQMVASR